MPPLAPASAPPSTDVLGYFNKNSFPLQITSEHLGVNMQVGPKSYVLDRAQRKINDPRLDFYASSGLLSKEFSKEPVPLVHLAGSPVAGAAPSSSVTSRTPTATPIVAPRVPVQGTITLPGMANRIPPSAVRPTQPSVSAPGINAMSVAEATRQGLIPRPDRHDHFAKLPNEDKTGEAARSAPSIDTLVRMPVPVRPQGLNLRSADVSGMDALEAENPAVALTTAEEAQPPDGLAVTASPAPLPAVLGRPTVEYDGRRFTTAGNLKRAMLKKFNGDQGMADEAFEAFKGKFAPQGKTKA